MASLSLGNGIGETWSFQTPEQQPTQLVASGTNASLTLGWSYGTETYNNGNIQSATIVGKDGVNATQQFVNATQQFTYDSINRLTAASEAGGWSQGYNYDAFGNLTGGVPRLHQRH
jgi:YD repeat-containing protein